MEYDAIGHLSTMDRERAPVANHRKRCEDRKQTSTTSSISEDEECQGLHSQRRKRPKTQHRTYRGQIVENSSCLSMLRIQALLDVQYLPKESSPSVSELQSLSVAQLFQCLLDFTFKTKIEGEAVMTQLLNETEPRNSLKVFFDESILQRNLKQCTDKQLQEILDLNTRSPQEINAKCFMRALLSFHKAKISSESPRLHDNVRALFPPMSYVTGFHDEKMYRIHGEKALDFERTIYHGRKSAHQENVLVKVFPDFIFGRDGSVNCIPVEVYSPEDQECLSSLPSTTVRNSTSESDVPYTLQEVTFDHVPDIGEFNVNLDRDDFKKKIAAQHVAQLYGVAKGVLKMKNFLADEKMTVIGMFVVDEYFFVSKMKLNAYHLYTKDKTDRDADLYANSTPVVEYFPTALDICDGNQRLALLAYLTHHKVLFFPN